MVFLRYFLSGGMATAVHCAVLLALVEWAGAAAAPAAVTGALCGAVTAYALNRAIAFTASTVSHQQVLPRFMLTAAGGAAFNGAPVWVGVHWLGWHYLVARARANVLVSGLTHRLNRSWTFA